MSIWSVIEAYPDKKWNWKKLSSRNDIPIHIIETHLDWPWDWPSISHIVPWNIIESNIDWKWDWDMVRPSH